MKIGLFVIWVLAGLLVGWLARGIARDGGYGRVEDLALGIAGSIAGGWFFWTWWASPGTDLVSSAVVSSIGAAAMIFAQRQFWPAHA